MKVIFTINNLLISYDKFVVSTNSERSYISYDKRTSRGPAPLLHPPENSIYVYIYIPIFNLGPRKKIEFGPLCFQKLGPLHKIKIKTQPKQHHNPNLTQTISQPNPNNYNHILKINPT